MIYRSFDELVSGWFAFTDNIGGVGQVDNFPDALARFRHLAKVYIDAMENPPEGVIGVGAITYAEQKLMEAQQGASSSLSSCLGGCAQHPFRGNDGATQMTNTFDFLDGKGPVPAHRHPKGGGWVADTARVAESAYIGPDAFVHGNAVVSGDARVSGNARAYGRAVVYGMARVYGDARVFDNAVVYGNTMVYGRARVSGDAVVCGMAALNRGEYTETPVTITRSDGYTFTLQCDGGVIAGCRDFTREQAIAHWGDPKHHKHAESMAILTALYTIADARPAPSNADL